MDTKKLRQKILDLAIHGKLVPQDPNDEPASVLLERIRAEKERLVKEGKIKKSKAAKTSDTPHYENVPIEVPASWSIIPLEYLATFSGGKTPSMDNKEYWNNGKHLWVTSKDMKSVHITDSLMKISDSALEQMNIYPKGTLLLVTRSGILRHTLPIAILGDEATVNQDIKTISCHFPNINRYLYYAIKAQEQVILEQYHKDGTTVDSIDFDKFKKLPIPLPPIEEQSRIIAEINRLFALVDTIENNQTDLESTIAQTKSKILDLAIHGKLVPQDPNDEPASELLKRINPDAEITCDNGQYGKVPNGWAICTIGNLFDVVSAKRVLKSDWTNKGIPFYRAREIVQLHREGVADKDLFITEQLFEELKDKFDIPKAGDIMLSAVGSIGYTYIVNEKDKFYYKDASVLCLKNINKLNSLYISMIFETSFVKEQMYDNSRGTTVDTITIEKLRKYFVPLPPLAEQYRIVAKIEELFSSIDNIQKALEV